MLFSALLSLLGTWVGTILAFYYSRENYEAGTRGALDALRSVAQRLGSTPVADVMMPRSAMAVLSVPAGQAIVNLRLSDIVAAFGRTGANGQRISRLPVLAADGSCLAFHRHLWSEMLASTLIAQANASQANPGQATMNMGMATLGPLIAQPDPLRAATSYADIIRDAVAVVARGATVADAKAAMEQLPGCQDVVVTGGGTRREPVLGWDSNIDITRLSKA